MPNATQKHRAHLMGIVRRRGALHGLEALSVRGVAGEAALATGSMRHVFPSREAMLVALADDVLARLRARHDNAPRHPESRLVALLPADPSGQEQARLEHLLRFNRAHHAAFERVAVASLSLLDSACGEAIRASGRHGTNVAHVRMLAALVEGLQLELATENNGTRLGEARGAIRTALAQIARG